MTRPISRRTFLQGCSGFAAAAAMRGFGITNLLFDNHALHRSTASAAPGATLSPQQPPNQRDLLVLIFVRGGLDGLNLLTPFNTSATDRDLYYSKLRPTLSVPAPNSSATRKAIDLDGRFALHPDAARGVAGVNVPNGHASDTGGLYALFQRGDLAIVDACGSPDVTGSHFDTELYVDLGGKNNQGGWLARYLDAAGEPNDALAVAPQWGIPPSLLSLTGRSAVAVPDPENFGPQWKTRQWTSHENVSALEAAQRALLEQMYLRGSDFIEQVGRSALQNYDMLRNVLETNYTPSAAYLTDEALVADYGHFGHSLKTIAQLAKSSLANPLRVATIDVGGGYDTHDNQGVVDWNGNSRYCRLITNLANNIKAFCDDMNADPAWRGRFVVVVVSEFGRVLYENSSGGTDHGAGNVMFVVGSHGNIRGGQVYGEWPGLKHFGFNDGLEITTDYRRVLADILTARMGVSASQVNSVIFPGLNYASGLGIGVPR
ncbi:DUF1501 domain-containing protein [Caldilinea sp.]|uniref:DUF1501 domain-containing protein n=1 Tax=Caldilinea sp. TaxID=2293560 RepID=UPI00257D1A31|nr:DUF1501 domain-containing protein [Caldilinea sp.]